jgi:ABC-type Fe3+ transport system permease subunit
MSFTPIQTINPSTALLGAADPIKLSRPPYTEDRSSYTERRIHGRTENNTTESNYHIIIIVIISAILFVTVISIYDVARSAIVNYYASISLNDPLSNNKQSDIERTLIANYNSFIAATIFSLICIISAIISIPILLYILHKSKS